MEGKGEIIIYQTEDGKNRFEVHLQKESIWLSQKMMAELFEKDSDTIGLHLKNIYKEEELDEKSTTEVFSVVQIEGKRGIKRKIKFYNLDAVISVGYRVNSKRETQFRIWATQTLKDHLIKGFTINEKRLKEQQDKFKELNQTVEFLKTTIGNKQLSDKETQDLLEIISAYTRSFILLNQFDSNSLRPMPSGRQLTYEINYDQPYYQFNQRIT